MLEDETKLHKSFNKFDDDLSKLYAIREEIDANIAASQILGKNINDSTKLARDFLRQNLNAMLNNDIKSFCDKWQNAIAKASEQIKRKYILQAVNGNNGFGQSIDAITAMLPVNAETKGSFKNILTDSLVSIFAGNRAIGGMVAPNQAYMVGENGPELFTPQSAGNITPNSRLSTDRAISINMNIAVNDANSFRKNQSQIIAEMMRVVNSRTH